MELYKRVGLRFLRALTYTVVGAVVTFAATNYVVYLNQLNLDPAIKVIIVAVIGAILQAADKAYRDIKTS